MYILIEDRTSSSMMSAMAPCSTVPFVMIHFGRNVIRGGIPASLESSIITLVEFLFFLLVSLLSFLYMYMRNKSTFSM